jgi:rod shape-determining protein MreC
MPRSRPVLLVVALLASAVLVLLDLVGSPATAALRTGGATVLGPLERLVGSARGAAPARGPAAAAGPQDLMQRAAAERAAVEQHQLTALLGAPVLAGARVLPARVVGVGAPGPGGPQRVTLDVGSRDGASADLTVVGAAGLVGRVVAVAPWTCDVLLLGSPSLTVAVRAGTAGTLGFVSGSRTSAARRLSLTTVEGGALRHGDVVTTLGSPGGRPFQPGIPVGTVSAVDAQPGRLTPAVTVVPAADPTTLDVVGILLSAPRTAPRSPAVAGTP